MQTGPAVTPQAKTKVSELLEVKARSAMRVETSGNSLTGLNIGFSFCQKPTIGDIAISDSPTITVSPLTYQALYDFILDYDGRSDFIFRHK